MYTNTDTCKLTVLLQLLLQLSTFTTVYCGLTTLLALTKTVLANVSSGDLKLCGGKFQFAVITKLDRNVLDKKNSSKANSSSSC